MVKLCLLQLAKWYKTKKSENKISQQDFYFSFLKVGIDKLLNNIPKKYLFYYL